MDDEREGRVAEALAKLPPETFKGLSIKQANFLREYMTDGNGVRAAMAAGYTKQGAHKTSKRLIKQPAFKSAIEEVKKLLKAENVYTHDKAMTELDHFIAKADRARQYTAISKMLEQKAKMSGVWEDKLHLSHTMKGGFNLTISGIDPPKPAIDVTPGNKQIGNKNTKD